MPEAGRMTLGRKRHLNWVRRTRRIRVQRVCLLEAIVRATQEKSPKEGAQGRPLWRVREGWSCSLWVLLGKDRRLRECAHTHMLCARVCMCAPAQKKQRWE